MAITDIGAWLKGLLADLLKQCFTGSVTLHFHKGKIRRVERNEVLAIE